MEVLQVADLIRKKIKELETERAKLLDQAQAKANAIRDYDLAFALAYLKIKNKVITHLQDEPIGNVAQSNIPIIAKGYVCGEVFDKDAEEGCYKALLTNIEAIKAELNGLQSINRNLSEI